MSEELLQEQNRVLKGLLNVMVELLPKHSPDCYGLQVHFRNRAQYCDCDMSEIRETVRGIN